MKHCAWIIALSVLMVSWTGFAQEPEKEPEDRRHDMFQQMKVRSHQLDLENRESEMEFEHRMRELAVEEREIELERQRNSLEKQPGKSIRSDMHRKRGKKHCKPWFMAVCAVLNILLAVWVFQDIRKRNTGSGIWIVVTLISGFFGALLYAIVRLGDKRE